MIRLLEDFHVRIACLLGGCEQNDSSPATSENDDEAEEINSAFTLAKLHKTNSDFFFSDLYFTSLNTTLYNDLGCITETTTDGYMYVVMGD